MAEGTATGVTTVGSAKPEWVSWIAGIVEGLLKFGGIVITVLGIVREIMASGAPAAGDAVVVDSSTAWLVGGGAAAVALGILFGQFGWNLIERGLRAAARYVAGKNPDPRLVNTIDFSVLVILSETRKDDAADMAHVNALIESAQKRQRDAIAAVDAKKK